MLKRLLAGAMIFLFVQVASAALDLELTQGMQGAIPITVLPFAGQGNNANDPQNITGVISADLNHSGRFKVSNNASDKNVTVSGDVKVNGDQAVVNFQLNPPQAGQAAPAALLSQQFTVKTSQLRALAHHISDLVYQQMTGDRGIFSTKIAYVVVNHQGAQPRYYLMVADQDGYAPKALLTTGQPIMSPAWSPNGKSIAYVSFESGNDAIYIQNLATGARRLVSHLPGMNSAPAWSPDGSKLALVLTKTGYPKIFVMNVASGGLTQETDGYAIDTEPSWSPDGRSLIFTSDRGGNPQIYQINLASKQLQRLSFTGNYNARAAFTQDGNSIVMLTQNGSGYDVAIQDLQSGRVTVLTNSGNVQSPSVAPNGKMVVYADHDQGNGILGMVSTDGKVKLRVPAAEGDVQEPAWSPFLN